jgi:large subunit ribosomal protein L13
MARKLKVYAGPDHPHVAQKPQVLELKIRKVEL